MKTISDAKLLYGYIFPQHIVEGLLNSWGRVTDRPSYFLFSKTLARKPTNVGIIVFFCFQDKKINISSLAWSGHDWASYSSYRLLDSRILSVMINPARFYGPQRVLKLLGQLYKQSTYIFVIFCGCWTFAGHDWAFPEAYGALDRCH